MTFFLKKFDRFYLFFFLFWSFWPFFSRFYHVFFNTVLFLLFFYFTVFLPFFYILDPFWYFFLSFFSFLLFLTVYRKYKLLGDGWWMLLQKVHFYDSFLRDILTRHMDGLWRTLMTCNDLWYRDIWQFWLSPVRYKDNSLWELSRYHHISNKVLWKYYYATISIWSPSDSVVKISVSLKGFRISNNICTPV